jgi:hypothetical protein
MADEVLESIAKDIRDIQTSLDRAKTLISAMKEAGEDTHEMEADVRTLEIRKTKWERMLKSRGITI